MWEPPEVEIAGEKYQLRRLGIKDLKGIYSIIQQVSNINLDDETVQELQDGEADLAQAGMQGLIQILPEATDKVVSWLVGIVDGLDEEDIDNPDKFPVHAPLEIITVLGEEHEDFQKFFTKGSRAMETFQKTMENLSPDSSTK